MVWRWILSVLLLAAALFCFMGTWMIADLGYGNNSADKDRLTLYALLYLAGMVSSLGGAIYLGISAIRRQRRSREKS